MEHEYETGSLGPCLLVSPLLGLSFPSSEMRAWVQVPPNFTHPQCLLTLLSSSHHPTL